MRKSLGQALFSMLISGLLCFGISSCVYSYAHAQKVNIRSKIEAIKNAPVFMHQIFVEKMTQQTIVFDQINPGVYTSIQFAALIRSKVPSNYDVTIPASVEVVLKEENQQKISEFLVHKFIKNCQSCEFQVTAHPDQNQEDVLNWGTLLNDQIQKGGRYTIVLKNKKWVSIQVKVFKNVPVAKAPLYKGQVISESDLKIERVELKPGSSILDSKESIIGQQLRKDVNAGENFLKQDLQSELLVRRGELVTAEMIQKNIRLGIEVRSEQDGQKGDIISVKNPISQQVFSVTVMGKGKVMVN